MRCLGGWRAAETGVRVEGVGHSPNCSGPPHLFGGWSEYTYLLPVLVCTGVPHTLPDEVAVLTEPMVLTHRLDRAVDDIVAIAPRVIHD